MNRKQEELDLEKSSSFCLYYDADQVPETVKYRKGEFRAEIHRNRKIFRLYLKRNVFQLREFDFQFMKTVPFMDLESVLTA